MIGAIITIWFFGSLVSVIAWCLLCDLYQRLEERRWRNECAEMQIVLDRYERHISLMDEEMDRLFDALRDPLDGLEDIYKLECAPDPPQLDA